MRSGIFAENQRGTAGDELPSRIRVRVGEEKLLAFNFDKLMPGECLRRYIFGVSHHVGI